MDEDFTKKSTCLLCDSVVDPKSEIQICSTCAIVAMSDEDFQDLNFISLTENIHPISINDKEKKRIFDLYVPAQDMRLIEKNYQKKSKRN
ncbi:MAG TPA: hypothetical protein VF248_03585 [Nitrososphaeraceae archaeon]